MASASMNLSGVAILSILLLSEMTIVFYEFTQQPRYWVAHDEDGYWLVPAREQGWHERSPFVGHATNLIPLLDFDGIDLGLPALS